MLAEMPYIDLRDYEQGLVLIETVCKNMGGFTHEEIEGAKLSRQTQGRVGNPPDAVFKQLIGTKELEKKLCLVKISLTLNQFLVPILVD